ncbi:MAG: fused MFS/spermidine synthase [Candidatus Omnitrophica bacterium]|nr:fused MFS/spermidine synthase [Candidatus Omnitrophota bacterium]
MKKTLFFSVICAGLTAMASQIILVREFLVLSGGDELSIGIILACWLINTALGSMALGNFIPKIKSKIYWLWFSFLFLAVYLPLAIFLCRGVRVALRINPGEILQYQVLGFCAFFILLPSCALLGFIFSLACRLYEDNSPLGSVNIAKVYALEAIGSMLGGLLTSSVLIGMFNSFEAIALLSLLNILLGFFIILGLPKKRLVAVGINSIFFIICIFLFLTGAWKNLETYSLKRQWPGFEVLESKNTIYANLLSLKRGNQVSFFENGTRLYTVFDKQLSEEAVHFCLLEHKNPRNILLIGAGFAGLLDEILKYPVTCVDYVELDPALVTMAKKHLPPLYTSSLQNTLVHVINTDARFFLKTTPKKYDCIILHLGAPYSAQINRFYTYDFFRRLKLNLKNEGILSFYLNASENYINAEGADFLRSVYSTLKTVFKEVKVIPGETVYFLASDTKGELTLDFNILMQRAKDAGLNLQYVREYYLISRLNPDKINYLNSILERNVPVRINRDFKPRLYYYGIISWGSRFRESIFTKVLKQVSEKKIYLIFALFLFGIAFFGARQPRNSISAALITAGFCQSVLQIILIYAFQVIYGYLFYKIGTLFASFMLGLGVSAWRFTKAKAPEQKTYSRLLGIQLAAAALFLILPLILSRLASLNLASISWLGANLFFPALSLLSGLLGGAIFAQANHIYLFQAESAGIEKTAAFAYGLDLLGACFGALSVVFLIPIMGIFSTCFLLASLNLVVFIVLRYGRNR